MILLVTEQRIAVQDGRPVAPSVFTEGVLSRVGSIFRDVVVAARVSGTAGPGLAEFPAGVKHVGLPEYTGLGGLIRSGLAVRDRLRAAVQASDAVIVRGPGPLAYFAAQAAARTRVPILVEVVGDPSDVFGRGGVGGAVGPVLRLAAVRQLQSTLRSASAVAYVSEALKHRYPAPSALLSGVFSGANLARVPRPLKTRELGMPPFSLVTVASMDQPYKGVDTLTEAVATMTDEGVDAALVVVGDGRLRARYERAAAQALPGRVRFTGSLPHADVLQTVSESDIFILASRTEGLPRAMIEAMALGLPCIGTEAGGIPELLPPSFVVPVDDHRGIARVAARLFNDPSEYAAASRQNMLTADEFRGPRGEMGLRQMYEQFREMIPK